MRQQKYMIYKLYDDQTIDQLSKMFVYAESEAEAEEKAKVLFKTNNVYTERKY